MPAGRLRDRVSLQARNPDAVPNAYNELPDDWVDLLTSVSAEVYAYAGREYVAAQQVQGAVTHRVTLRTPPRVAILQAHRFVWIENIRSGGNTTHYLDIKQVVNLQKPRGYTECICSEHVGG